MGTLREGIKNIPIFGSVIYKLYMKQQVANRHKSNVKRVNELQKPSSPCIFYLDVPIHANLGDNAQYICIKNWLKDNYPNYSLVELDGLLLTDKESGVFEKLEKIITPADMIFFQSGYCTQDLGGYHDFVHREVVSAFPDIPIIMLPQTVYFKNKENAERTASVYRQHNKMFFMTRDFTSERIAKELFPFLSIQAFPDIVTTMIGTRENDKCDREGVVFCIRNDSEKFYSDEAISRLKKSVDMKYPTEMCDTTIKTTSSDFRKEIEIKIEEMLVAFQKAKVIVTDRYHGTIFSLVAGTPVVVIKTTDHKVRTGVEWFEGVYDDYVFYCDSLDEAESKISELYDKNLSHKLAPYFKENYYDRLKCIIDQWLEDLDN